METVNIHEAKAKLSGLITAVERGGKTVVLSRYGKPVARIVPYQPRKRSQKHRNLSKVCYTGDLTAPTVKEWSNA